jgi:hypothetical protein
MGHIEHAQSDELAKDRASGLGVEVLADAEARP